MTSRAIALIKSARVICSGVFASGKVRTALGWIPFEGKMYRGQHGYQFDIPDEVIEKARRIANATDRKLASMIASQGYRDRREGKL